MIQEHSKTTPDVATPEYVTSPIVAPNFSQAQRLPEFTRLPVAGSAEYFSGLKRSKLNELILPTEANGFKPPVKSVCLRKPGQAKGVRLIVLASLLDYLHSQAEAAQ